MKNTTDPLAPLTAVSGQWRGTYRFQDPHRKQPEESPSVLSLAPILNGRFIRITYSWAYQRQPQEGIVLLGFDADQNVVNAQWIDTWHMDRKIMTCLGAPSGPGSIKLYGSYGAPPGPDWGWRIELSASGGALSMRMWNITPTQESIPAVEADYSREPKDSATASDARLSQIRQIAITVKDVQISLPFYRDTLGLEFLFAPSPQLAFLAAGDVRIMLCPPQGAGKVGENSILYFRVSNIASVHEAIIRRGATNERAPQLAAKMPDHELWIGFIRDPDGNLIGLMEEKR